MFLTLLAEFCLFFSNGYTKEIQNFLFGAGFGKKIDLLAKGSVRKALRLFLVRTSIVGFLAKAFAILGVMGSVLSCCGGSRRN